MSPVKPESIALRRYDITPPRDRFMHASEVVGSWVLLAPVTGGFSYTLGPGPDHSWPTDGASTSGRCSSGEILLCPPNVVMERHLLEPSRFWFAEFDVVDPDLEPWWPVGKVSVADRGRLRTNFRLLDHSQTLREPRREHACTHVLVDVLVTIGWEHQPSMRPADPMALRGAARLEAMVCDAEVSIEALAEELNLSPTQFTRRFRQAYGVPPIRYLTELRLAKTQRLLVDTEESVAAIAAQCGYRSPFYFSRVFRKFTGQTPTGYRESRRV